MLPQHAGTGLREQFHLVVETRQTTCHSRLPYTFKRDRGGENSRQARSERVRTELTASYPISCSGPTPKRFDALRRAPNYSLIVGRAPRSVARRITSPNS